MTDRNPLVCVNGSYREMTDGDSIPPKLIAGDLGDYKYSFYLLARNGWYPCIGGTMSETCWANLVAAGLSDAWTLAFGAQTIPDFSAKVLAQASASHPVGSTTGEEVIALTIDQLPAHAHTLTNGTAILQTGVNIEGTNNVPNPKNNVLAKGLDSNGGQLKNFCSAGVSAGAFLGGSSISGSTDTSGSGADISVMQPTVYAGCWHVYLGT